MNFFSPELLLLSGQVALLVLLASLLAFFTGWLWNGKRSLIAMGPAAAPFTPPTEPAPAAAAADYELHRSLAATESQCVEALEQRDEAERLALVRAAEVRQMKEELAKIQEQKEAQAASLREGADQEAAQLRQQLKDLESAHADLQQKHTALKVQLDQLPSPAVPQSPRLPRPPLPSAEELATPVDETLTAFPQAPAATLRKSTAEAPRAEGGTAPVSAPSPALEEARLHLTRLQAALEVKELLAMSLGQEDPVSESRLQESLKDRDRSRRQVRALTRSLEHASTSVLRPDNLTLIKGIKGGINQQLHAFGIFSFQQILAWDEEDMLAFSELLAFKNRIQRDKWQDQARALMGQGEG